VANCSWNWLKLIVKKHKGQYPLISSIHTVYKTWNETLKLSYASTFTHVKRICNNPKLAPKKKAKKCVPKFASWNQNDLPTRQLELNIQIFIQIKLEIIFWGTIGDFCLCVDPSSLGVNNPDGKNPNGLGSG